MLGRLVDLSTFCRMNIHLQLLAAIQISVLLSTFYSFDNILKRNEPIERLLAFTVCVCLFFPWSQLDRLFGLVTTLTDRSVFYFDQLLIAVDFYVRY